MNPHIRLGMLLVLCHYSFLSIAQRPSSPAVDFLTGDQIHRDLDSLEAWILRIHPSPFVHCSSVDFEQACLNSRETFEGGGSLFAEAQMVARICNTLKDSHTGLSLRSFSNQLGETYGHLPLEIKTVRNQLRISRTYGDSNSMGQEVVAVNGVPARSILGSSLPLVSQEGDAKVARLRVAEKLWNDIAPFVTGSKIGDEVTVQLKNGQSFELLVQTNEEMQELQRQSAKAIHWTEMVDEANNGTSIHLKIGHFHPENLRLFRRELQRCFRAVKDLSEQNQNFKGLVLDLRGNSGGHISIMAELLPYLISEAVRIPYGVQIKVSETAKSQLLKRRRGWFLRKEKYDKNLQNLNEQLGQLPLDTIAFVPFSVPITPDGRLNYNGPVALIMDGLSASASVSIASWFVRSGRGMTFGEPPMGSISGTFGNPVQIKLPESGLLVNIASARYFTQNPMQWVSLPLLPDFPVIPDAEQVLRNIDAPRNRALEWLNDID